MCAFVENIVSLRHCLWNVNVSAMQPVDKVQNDEDKANDARVFCAFII